jgi:hypothetical protein
MDWKIILTSSVVAGFVSAFTSVMVALLTLRFQRKKESYSFRFPYLITLKENLENIEAEELSDFNSALQEYRLSGKFGICEFEVMTESIRLAAKKCLRLYISNKTYLEEATINELEPMADNTQEKFNALVALQKRYLSESRKPDIENIMQTNSEYEDSFLKLFSAFKTAVDREIDDASRLK